MIAVCHKSIISNVCAKLTIFQGLSNELTNGNIGFGNLKCDICNYD